MVSLPLGETADSISKGQMAADVPHTALVHKGILVHVAGRLCLPTKVQSRELLPSGAEVYES